VEKRLGRLEVLYQANPQAISEASYSIEWALKWPRMGLRDDEPARDPATCAAGITTLHGLDDAGVQRAIELALVRCGVNRADAGPIATLGLNRVLAIAITGEAKEIA
jgi:hypothetical protein